MSEVEWGKKRREPIEIHLHAYVAWSLVGRARRQLLRTPHAHVRVRRAVRAGRPLALYRVRVALLHAPLSSFLKRWTALAKRD